MVPYWKPTGNFRQESRLLPLFEVPEAPRYRLERAPLVQALAQVRFPLVATLETMPGIAPLQELLRGTFPYMEQELVQEVSLVVGPAGPAGGAGATSVTWKLTNDAGTLVVVGAGSATLSAGASYVTVEAFADDFERVLLALQSVSVPSCDRLGVRYLSMAPDLPGDDRSWRRWFKPELYGWAGSDVVAEGAIETSVSQVFLRQPPTGDLAGPPADVRAIVRHGAVQAGTDIPGVPPIQVSDSSYLIDLDVYVEGRQRFDPTELLRQFKLFHSQIDRLFHWSLTQEGKEHFGMVH